LRVFDGRRQGDDARFREGGGALEAGGSGLRVGRRVLGVIDAAVERQHQLGAGLLVLGEERRFEFLDGGIALGRSARARLPWRLRRRGRHDEVRAGQGSERGEVCSAVFGGSLVLLYFSSTLYHAVWHLKTKQILYFQN
jgi:hypothetical protein